MSLFTFIAFFVGYILAMFTHSFSPMTLNMARRRGFLVGWEVRPRYPADAPPRSRQEVDQLLKAHPAEVLAELDDSKDLET